MKDEYKEPELINNTELHQFEMKVGDNLAFIEYRHHTGAITLIHTEVEPELEGKGAATAIIEKTLNYIEKNNFTVIPQCPLVAAYIKRHPEWKRIVDKKAKNL